MEDITLVRATRKNGAALSRLLQLFAYDLSEYAGASIGANGLFDTRGSAREFLAAPGYRAYYILRGGALCGLAVVRLAETHAYLRHFFILRAHRGQGVGRAAAHAVFATQPGAWRVSTMDENAPAAAFWRAACPGAREGRRADGRGPQFDFVFPFC